MKSIATLLLMCDGRDLGLAFGQGDEAQGETRPTGGRTALPDQSGRRAADLPVRCVSGRHRLLGAAARHAPRPARSHPRAHRRLRLRPWLPDLRRADWRDRATRQVGGAGAAGRARRARAARRRTGVHARGGVGDRAGASTTCPSDGDAEAVTARNVCGRSWRGAAPAVPRLPRRSQASWPDRSAERARHAATTLGGAVHEAAGGRCIVVDRHYGPDDRHGRHAVANIVAPCRPRSRASRRSAAPGPAPRGVVPPAGPLLQDLDGLCVVDLETTGLAGGAGTQAFLVGCARLDGDGVIDPAVPVAGVRGRARAAAPGVGVDARSHAAADLQRPHLRRAAARDALQLSPAGVAVGHCCRTSTRCIRRAASGAIDRRSPGSTPTTRAARSACSSGG